MRKNWYIVICFLMVTSGYGADYRSMLRQRQSLDGLWRDSCGIDLLGSLFAIDTLAGSSRAEDMEACQRGCAAIHLNSQSDASLLDALSYAVASRSSEVWELSRLHHENGWSQEEAAYSDWASTLLALMLLPEKEIFSHECEYLLKETADSFDNPRLAMMVAHVLIRHRLPLPDALIQAIPSAMQAGIFEQALAMHASAKLSNWDEAMALRERLLSAQLPEGGWGEEVSLPFDLVTTCLVIQALDCARVSSPAISVDLRIDEEHTHLEPDSGFLLLDTTLFNDGNLGSSHFLLTASAINDHGMVPLASHTISYLAPEHSQRVILELTVPEGSNALILEADAEGVTGDCKRENNMIVIPLSDQAPPPMLGQMLFDWRTPDYPYDLNPGFGAVASVPMLCLRCVSPISWHWACDGSIFSSGTITPESSLPSGVTSSTLQNGSSSVLFSADCFPPEGIHILSFRASYTLDGMEQWLETAMEIEIHYGSCRLICESANDGRIHPQESFKARETIHFQAISSYPDASISVSIFSSTGEYLGNAAAEMRPGCFQWNCESLPPGNYKAVAEFWDYEVMETPLEAERNFLILPTSKSSSLAIRAITDKASGNRLYSGISCHPLLSLSWETAANQPTSCQLCWELLDESGAAVASSQTPTLVEASLTSLRQWHQLQLDELLIHTPGNYQLSICLITNGTAITTTCKVVFSPKPGLHYDNRLCRSDGELDNAGVLHLPAQEHPTLTETLRLEIMMDNLALPASVQLPEAPIRLAHTQSASATIELSQICNAEGQPIPSGWLLCLTPYGVLEGGNELAPGWESGSCIVIPIQDGFASFHYSPQGEHQLELIIPIELIPWQEEDASAYERIGIVEILLTPSL